jgi:hypothetical protein
MQEGFSWSLKFVGSDIIATFAFLLSAASLLISWRVYRDARLLERDANVALELIRSGDQLALVFRNVGKAAAKNIAVNYDYGTENNRFFVKELLRRAKDHELPIKKINAGQNYTVRAQYHSDLPVNLDIEISWSDLSGKRKTMTQLVSIDFPRRQS